MHVSEKGEGFDLDRSRTYWRHAPSGIGKHDTRLLLSESPARLLDVWTQAFQARFRGYPEEDVFLREMAKEFAGKRVLSIGSGLGFHEVYYARNGAFVTCVDIVESNLKVIERVAELSGITSRVNTICCADSSETPYDSSYDVVFIYGSLMTMPEPYQAKLLAKATAALTPDGRLVLMLYTWDFARLTCGWQSPDQFDPAVFARASDPSVAEEHCPWSDWHDDAKLLEMTGSGFVISHRQTWNYGLYVWYSLTRSQMGMVQPFFDTKKIIESFAHRDDLDVTLWPVWAATRLDNEDGIRIRTHCNTGGYAIGSQELILASKSKKENCVAMDVTLIEGGLSVGILDVESQTFVASQIVSTPSRHVVLIAADLPKRFQIIVSNYSSGPPAESTFTVHTARIGHQAWVQ